MSARREKDGLGELNVPGEALFGIHTLRAIQNFPLTHRLVHPELIKAYATVKLACQKTIRQLSISKISDKHQAAVEQACEEIHQGLLPEAFPLDALQGGAGTSLNMNLNEVIANRALQLVGEPLGNYNIISPLNHINLFQSTNDTYPTALKVAAITLLKLLEASLLALQEAFQAKEKEFAHIVKLGRTEMQDAVLTTLGREMSAYAEVFSRDRWRIYKCMERLRVVNLGGTAIGTGLAASRQYIFQVTDTLRELTGFNLSRAENLVDATQNADVFVEVSGILKACAASLIKVSNDLRLLSSGPSGGFGEIILPPMQSGSSIMPGKVNPVIPEAVIQAGMVVTGLDITLTQACANGSLELNPFMPLIADTLLNEIDLLTHAAQILAQNCVLGLKADEPRCKQLVENSTAIATALLPVLGYEGASKAAQLAKERNKTLRATVLEEKWMTGETFDQLISPEAVLRLGTPLPSHGATP